MPYESVADLPANVKKLPPKTQRQWMHVWNSSFQTCMAKDEGGKSSCESEAFAKANGVVKGAEMTDSTTKQFYDNLIRLEKTDSNVNYKEAADAQDWHCGSCRFFERWSRSCSLVEGTIEPSYVCDLWTDLLPSQRPIGALMDDAAVYTEQAFQIFLPTPEAFADTDFSKPGWIPYLPKPGKYQHALYGEVEITKDGNQEIIDSINNKVYQEQIPLDAEHQSKLSGAVGWITKGRVNKDGTGDAYVEWTARGQSLLKDGNFKYISPEWFPAWREPATGTVYNNVAAGGAITTRPFFKDKVLRALVASEAGDIEWISKETKVDKDPKEPVKGADDKDPKAPKTYAEGSPELQKIIDDAKAEAKAEALKAAEPPKDDKKVEPAKPAEGETAAFTELKAELDAQKTLAASEKTAREAATTELATIKKAERERRFKDLVAGRGGAGDGAAWAGDADANVAILTSMAEKFGEEDEAFTKYVEQQTKVAAQMATAGLFSEAGHSGSSTVTGSEAKIEEMVSARMKSDPALSHAKAYAEVMNTDEAKRLYGEIKVVRQD